MGWKSPRAKQIMRPAILLVLIVGLAITCLAGLAVFFDSFSPDRALQIGALLLVLTTALVTPAALRARQFDYEYKARLIDEKYGEQGGND